MADKEEMRTAKGTVPNSKYYEPKGGDEARFFKKHVVKLVDKIRNDQPNRPKGVNGGGEVFDTPPKVKKDDTVKAHPDTEGGEDEYVYEEAPPGMENTVMALKKKFPGKPEKAFKIAWSMYNKKNEEYLGEMGEPMSAAPATSDSPSAGGNQAPTSSSNFKNDMSQNGNDDDDDANVSPIRKELEALALTAAQLYEIMDDQVNDQETSTKISDALISIQEIYDAAANSTNNTSNDKKPTDDNTSGRPDATSNGAQPSMAKEDVDTRGGHPYKMTYIKLHREGGPNGSAELHHTTIHTHERVRPGDSPERIGYLVGRSPEHRHAIENGYKIHNYGQHYISHGSDYYGKPITYTGEKSESKLHGGQEKIDVARPFGEITAKDLRDLRQKAKMKKKMKSEEVEQIDELKASTYKSFAKQAPKKAKGLEDDAARKERYASTLMGQGAAPIKLMPGSRDDTEADKKRAYELMADARKQQKRADNFNRAAKVAKSKSVGEEYDPEGEQIDEINSSNRRLVKVLKDRGFDADKVGREAEQQLADIRARQKEDKERNEKAAAAAAERSARLAEPMFKKEEVEVEETKKVEGGINTTGDQVPLDVIRTKFKQNILAKLIDKKGK